MADAIADPNVIAHYGRKGMKWGVRRPVGSDGKVKGSSSTASADHIESRKAKKVKLAELSNKDLQALNNRLQLERTNRQLQTRDALTAIKKGTAVVNTVVGAGTAVTTLIAFSKSPLGLQIREAFKQATAK